MSKSTYYPQGHYDNSMDLNTEGYITQLIESTGRKIITPLKPHSFNYRKVKGVGVVPVTDTNYNNDHNAFYGQITYSSEYNTGLSKIDFNLLSAVVLTLKPITGNFYIPNLLFDTMVDTNSNVDVSANTYDVLINFMGYSFKIS